MSHKKSLVVVLALLLVLTSLVPVFAQDRVQVTWFVGLGTGTQQEQIDVQNQVVADFNASQDEVELVINIASSNEAARDLLSTLIASGQAPDIVGPVGVGGSHPYADYWVDLQPLVDSTGFDMSGFDPALVDLYRAEDGRLLGIPFLVFPSLTFYNRGLFDEAGLNYPPQEFDAPYVMPDGTEVPWDFNTVAEIGKILTVDANGNDATMEGFDPNNIVQFGFNMQWARWRLMMTDFQPAAIYDAEANAIDLPAEWYTGSQWIQDAIWNWHIWPNTAYDGSELLNSGNAFASGNIAMAVTPLWYTCCLDGSTTNGWEFDIAVVPRSFDGEYHVATDADTFRLVNPTEEAFSALSYLLTDAAGTLAVAYGGYPALVEFQQPYLDAANARYPFGINFDVATASLAYNNPGPMHHEAWLPNWQKAHDTFDNMGYTLAGETGGEIDITAALDQLEADVNTIINE